MGLKAKTVGVLAAGFALAGCVTGSIRSCVTLR